MAQIASKNIYALLDDDYVEAQTVKTAPEPTPAPTEKQATKPAQINGKKNEAGKRNDNGKKFDNRKKNAPVKKGDFVEKPEHEDSKPSKPKGHQAPKHGRPRDRRSQGVNFKSGEKKEVAGPGAWGDEIEAQTEAQTEVQTEEVQPAAEETEAPEVVEKEKEPEENLKSLADFLKEKEAARLTPATSARLPNDGVEDAKWKKMTLVQKEEEAFISGKAVVKERKPKEVKAKVTLAIEQTFAPPPREPRQFSGKGGRGERSDRAERGGNRADSGKGRKPNGGNPKGKGNGNGKAIINVNDENLFPVLGGN